MTAEVHLFSCLSDNFGALLHDPATGATAAIDVPEAAPYLAALAQKGWVLSDILITHRHGDHIDGAAELRAHFPKARLHVPAAEAEKIVARTGPADHLLKGGDRISIGTFAGEIIETPGHTAGHIVYHFADERLLFAGDTLFSLGCGRVFETGMETMWRSLEKLLALPADTRLYCGHEYTLANGRFALSVEPANIALQQRMDEARQQSAQGRFTIPTTMAMEQATNPFLRAARPEMAAALGMTGASAVDIFAHLRELKNKA